MAGTQSRRRFGQISKMRSGRWQARFVVPLRHPSGRGGEIIKAPHTFEPNTYGREAAGTAPQPAPAPRLTAISSGHKHPPIGSVVDDRRAELSFGRPGWFVADDDAGPRLLTTRRP